MKFKAFLSRGEYSNKDVSTSFRDLDHTLVGGGSPVKRLSTGKSGLKIHHSNKEGRYKSKTQDFLHRPFS